MLWTLRTRTIGFPRRPLIMGIVNINDDSFCGDGTLDARDALHQARIALEAGAEIIDIGAESARTNREPITEAEEIARLRPFMEQWDELVGSVTPTDPEQLWPPVLSVNTWRPGVIAAVLPLGAALINDISALPDPTNAELCAAHGASLLIMHSIGVPKVAHTHVRYDHVMDSLDAFFAEKIRLAEAAGLTRDHLLLDPGIDFAKQTDDNLTIYRDLDRLQSFGRPILLPVSRKTVIGHTLNLPDPLQRDAGTIACIASGIRRGASIFRVHNVSAAAAAVRMLTPLMA